MFNPFGKDFEEVKESDLELLKSIAEGWYIEYKKEKLNGRKISKSIASFANSHGGIYFIGIDSDTKTNFATNIIGIKDSPDIIRDSVRGNLQPFPLFETFTLPLRNGMNVLMVVIPEGKNPPYINSDGIIYRRQGSASDPIPETNRHIIDELYKKAQKYDEDLEKFRKCELTFCKGEDSLSYLEIYATPKPFKHHFIEDLLFPEKMLDILKKFNEPYKIKDSTEDKEISFGGTIFFDTINTYHNSIVLRTLSKGDFNLNGLSMEIDIYGNLKILLPLTTIFGNSEEYDKDLLEALNKKYNSREGDTSTFDIKFLSGRLIFGAILAIFKKYSDFLSEASYKDMIEIKFRLINCWKTSLYFQSKNYLDFVEKFGLPICMKNEQYYPLQSIEKQIKEIEEKPLTILTLFAYTACALGMPVEIATTCVLEEMLKSKSG